MKVLERLVFDGYEVRCKCDSLLEVAKEDLKLVRLGYVAYSCPVCKKVRVIKETKLLKRKHYESQ